MLWVTLTSSLESNSERLADHAEELRRRVETELGFEGMVYVQVRTSEGQGVLHCIWAWGPKPGERWQEFWVGKRWLSRNWLEIHGAHQVNVQRVRAGMALARYLVSQYMAGQELLVRLSWSWMRLFKFPLAKFWRQWWRDIYGLGRFREAVSAWSRFLRGQVVRVADRRRLGNGVFATVWTFFQLTPDGVVVVELKAPTESEAIP